MSLDYVLKSSLTPSESKRKSLLSQKSVSKGRPTETELSRSKTSETSNLDVVELSEEEEKQRIVDSIRTEIIETALEIIYEKYLEKQTVYFVSHCSRLAWKALIEWNYQRKDKGGFKEAEKDQLDVEPEPSPKDSWAGHSVPVAQKNTAVSTASKEEAPKSTMNESSEEDESKSFEESETHDYPKTAISCRTKFRGKLPTKQKSEDVSTRGHEKGKSVELRKESYELPSPVAMQLKYLPASRVEVRYRVTASTRGMVVRRAPAPTTIRLTRQRPLPNQNNANPTDMQSTVTEEYL